MNLDDLYRDVVMDHYKNPRGREPLERVDLHAEGANPSCGDEVGLDLQVEEGRIQKVGVRGRGCAVSTASGSILAEMVEGLTLEEAARVARRMKDALKGEIGPGEIDMGDLEALTGVRKFPVRIKCALLPWVTLLQALLEKEGGP